ncbi:glycine betaine/L-proline ABC transporter ATP-binding protein [Mesorhizobium sp. SP-1A]|uniref:quaternary amine ABC transporter ATP-binding protein n=1 Tax=Mesorhizobium sp. SP-1A TaxID=3077840 RepID=UPI0028F6F7F9|nr:glycine betaine/L-proline ABC transporter ATP-binding protein [Mesorhizobium sp. SP-1A]
MTDRITIENLYKIFGKSPEAALRLLAQGESKETVLGRTGQVVGLHDVSLSVPAGSIYMIMGLSGSGKSTLARCINRLVEPDAGRILIDGEEITGIGEARLREVRRTRISMVFQHFALLPNRTVVENAEFGLKLRGIGARERRRKAMEVLDVVGLASWAHHRPSALSGGMRQRVGLARALATEADVLIMDEAFSALDPLIRSEMQEELLRLQQTLRKTILFITHDFQEALKLGTRIAIMSEGAVVREGTPQEIVQAPGNDYVAAFTRDVDRSRVFDAASIMSPVLPIVIGPNGLFTREGEPAPDGGFAVDPEGRLLGYCRTGDIEKLRVSPRPHSLLSQDYVAVSGEDKLVEVAAHCRPERPVAVVDREGRFEGSIETSRILSRIGEKPAI